jgi:cellobiose-specific phosphotransferase system component IIA
MKKMVSFFATFLLLCSMFPAHVVHAAGADDLVKCSDFPAVYYVGDDGARYVFPNENIYFSWYPDFSEVKTISCEDLASFPIGDRLVYRPGTSLVKMPSDPSVYAVESDGVLREIPSEEVAEDLFGDDWEGRVDDVSEAFWSSFTVGEPLEAGEIPEGMVFEDSDGNLYRVGDDGSATEVDVVLDTDDEDVLQSFALSLDDVERRLGIAVALVRIDASAAIAILEELLAELKPVRVDDDEVKDVDEVDEVEDGGSEDDARDAIEDAEEEIAEAERDIAEDEADGKDITESEVLLASAQEHLDLAEAAYGVGDFAVAEEHADEAKHDAMWARGKAVDSIDDEQEDLEDGEDEDGGGDSEDRNDSEDDDVSDDGDSEDASEDSDSGEDSNGDENEGESSEDADESDESEGSGQDSEDSSERED